MSDQNQRAIDSFAGMRMPHLVREYHPWRTAILVLSACACLVLATSGGHAQHAEPRVTLAPTIRAEPASQAPLPIEVGPSASLPNGSFVRLRGLPPSVSLTVGYVIGPGSWAIPLFGLPTLKANVPAGVSGRSELVVSLVNVDGKLLAEAKSEFVVGPKQSGAKSAAEPPAGRANALTPPAPVPALRPDRNSHALVRPPELSAEDKSAAEKLVSQGERFLVQGNIAVARQFFRRAADAGLAVGAIRLAATYDPAELARLQAQGVVPDRAEARKWYERARELGAPEAEERLARLGDS
jgi:hypothetical protein